jgi:hypothetical protein
MVTNLAISDLTGADCESCSVRASCVAALNVQIDRFIVLRQVRPKVYVGIGEVFELALGNFDLSTGDR